jgi:hypothetical protein
MKAIVGKSRVTTAFPRPKTTSAKTQLLYTGDDFTSTRIRWRVRHAPYTNAALHTRTLHCQLLASPATTPAAGARGFRCTP